MVRAKQKAPFLLFIAALAGVWLSLCALSPSSYAAQTTDGGNGEVECAQSCNKDCGTDGPTGIEFKKVGACCTKYGCCPVKPQKPFATKCTSLVSGKDFDDKLLNVPPGDGKLLPFCGEAHKPKVQNAQWNVSANAINSQMCNQQLVSNNDSQCEEESSTPNERKYCIKKMMEKKTACEWRQETIMGANSQALASAANPTTPGFQKMPFGDPDLLCVNMPQVAAAPDNNAFKNALNPQRNPEGQYAGGLLGKVAQSMMPQNQQAFDDSGSRGQNPDRSGATGNDMHQYAGKQTDMYTDPGRQYAFNSDKGGYVTQGKFADSHQYNRDNPYRSLAAAHLNTPAFATYDPKNYPPGKEIEMARKIEGKTVEEVLAAKEFGNLVINESIAAAGGGGGQLEGLVERLLPDVAKFVSNSEKQKFSTGLSFAQKDYGLKLTNFFGPGAGGLTSLLNGGGGGGFMGLLQQIIQQASGGGGGGGGGSSIPASCTASAFGDPNQCITSLAAAPDDVDLKNFSFPGCPRSVLDCMQSNHPQELSRCYQEETDKQCSADGQGGTGGGGSGGGGGGNQMMQQLLSQLKSLFGNMGSGANMQQLAQLAKPKQLTDLYKTKHLQIFDPSHPFSNLAHHNMYPERDHYSPVAVNQVANYSRNMKGYNYWIPYFTSNGGDAALHPDTGTKLAALGGAGGGGGWNPVKDAVRCSGKADRLIRVNVTEPRYDEYNCHMAQRQNYDRYCWADGEDKLRCTPGHPCCPKPCHPRLPCHSAKKCWMKAPGSGPRCTKQPIITSDIPPGADDYDRTVPLDSGGYGHMIRCCPPGTTGTCTKAYICRYGFCGQNWAYHPQIKYQMDRWAKQTKADLKLTCKEKFINDICHDLAKPYPVMNKFLLADARELDKAKAQAPEGSPYMAYFGLNRPCPADSQNKKHPWGEFGQTTTKPDLNSFDGCAVVADFTGNMPVASAAGGAKASLMPEINMGYRDGGLGLAKDVLAAAGAGGGGGNGGSTGPCYGGTGGKTGEGCGSNGTDPGSAFGEEKLQQAYNARNLNLSCLMKYERSGATWSPESFVANATGAQLQSLVKSGYKANPGAKETSEKFIQRSLNIPNACRGAPDHVESAEAFPVGGGVQPPKEENGLDKLFDMKRNAGGAVLKLDTGGAKKAPYGIPRTAVVQYAVQYGDSKAIVVTETNMGTHLDNMGRSADGQGTITRYYMDKLPDDIKKDIKKAKFHRDDCIGPGIVPQFCEIDWGKTKWVHYGKKDNKSIKADNADDSSDKVAGDQK